TAEVTAAATEIVSTPGIIILVTPDVVDETTTEATVEATIIPTAEITAEATELAAGTRLVTPPPHNVNLRTGPGTDFDRTGTLSINDTTLVEGQAIGDDGAVWYHTQDDSWLRSNLVIAQASCADVPTVTPQG